MALPVALMGSMGGGAAAGGLGLGGILSGISGLAGLFGGGRSSGRSAKLQNQALKSQTAISNEQLQMIKNLQPFLAAIQGGATSLIPGMSGNANRANQAALSFDPAKQTEQLTGAYDKNLGQAIPGILGSVTANSAAKGFDVGTGDSDTGGMLQDTLAKTAGARASYIGGLKQQEPGLQQSILGAANQNASNTFGALDPASAVSGRYGGAVGALNGPAGILSNVGQQYGAQAAQWDPTSSIASIGQALQGLMKLKQPQTTGSWNSQRQPSYPMA